MAWPAADRIARGSFSEPVVAIDAGGAFHIAVTGTGSDNHGIWYLTNATGGWVKQQIVTPWDSDTDTTASVNEPAIAIDPSDGSVWIAFVYWQCAECIPNWPNGIFIVNNAGGVWSTPDQLAGDGLIDPSLAVRDGHIYFAGAVAGDYTHRYGPVMFATNASGAWAVEQIARAGARPHLTIDADGRAAVLFGGSAMRYARQRPNGSFAVERLPAASSVVGSVWSSRLGVDPVTGDAWAAWTGDLDDEGHVAVFVAHRGAAGWSDPTTAIADAELIGLGVRDGVVQLTAAAASALIYASNGSGAFVEQTIDGSSTWGSFWGASALTLLATGRPIVVFTRDEENGPSGPLGVWFLKGPPV